MNISHSSDECVLNEVLDKCRPGHGNDAIPSSPSHNHVCVPAVPVIFTPSERRVDDPRGRSRKSMALSQGSSLHCKPVTRRWGQLGVDSSPSHSGGTSVGGSITQAEGPRRCLGHHCRQAKHHPTKETKEGMGPSLNIRENKGFQAEVMEKKAVSVIPQGLI